MERQGIWTLIVVANREGEQSREEVCQNLQNRETDERTTTAVVIAEAFGESFTFPFPCANEFLAQ